MICNETEDGWEFIYQRAHALLAAKLITYWREEERPDRWTETLNAVAQHDNGWQEWEGGDFLNEDGTPRSFLETPMDHVIIQAARVVIRAWHQSLWVGLMVSSHISYLHEPKRGRDPELDAILDEQLQFRAQWAETLGVATNDVEGSYDFLRMADDFSLHLSMRKLEAPGEKANLAKGPNGICLEAFRRDDGTIGLDPWPYDRDQFPVSVDTYCVSKQKFSSNEELLEALWNAKAQPREWILRKH